MKSLRTTIAVCVVSTATLAPLAGCSRTTPPLDGAAAPTERRLPPPTRPTDVLAEAHFGHPHASADRLGRMIGGRIPLDLGLALGLGLDSVVISAADSHRPIDVVVTGNAERQDTYIVLTPATNNQLRPTLSGRFRFTRIDGVGERLDPREQSRREERMHCALISVPHATDRRIVCTRRSEALTATARWAAYRAAEHASDERDAWFDVDPIAVRTVLLPRARRNLQRASRGLAEDASRERREHDHPPDFGDPEAVIGMFDEWIGGLERHAADLHRLSGTIAIEANHIDASLDIALDPAGESSAARNTVTLERAAQSHPLAARLPPDAFAAYTQRNDSHAHVHALHNAADTLVRVLGTRLPNPDVVRADLRALFDHTADAIAAGAARQSGGGFETTVLLAQDDAGANARAVLARVARAPWLRTLRLGGAPVLTTFRNNTLTVQLGEAPAARNPRVPAGFVPPREPPTLLGITVDRDALTLVAGRDPTAAMVALAARVSGPTPAVLDDLRAPIAAGVDLARLASSRATDRAPVQLSYSARREGAEIVGQLRLRANDRAISAIRALTGGSSEERSEPQEPR